MKRFISILFCVFTFSTVFSLSWPQNINLDDDEFDFVATFAESRGYAFSYGVSFVKPDTVKATDKGFPLITIKTSPDMGWFESTLGNAVIIAHDNDLMSIYGNLSSISISPKATRVDSGDLIGISGKSGYQENPMGLEFQLCDIQKKTVINPYLLLQRSTLAKTPLISSVVAVNKDGTEYDLSKVKTIPTGVYSIYKSQTHSRENISQTMVTVNGIEIETITYDMMQHDNDHIFLQGSKPYSYSLMYPDSTKQLVTNTTFTKGKVLLSLTVTNFEGISESASFNFEVR